MNFEELTRQALSVVRPRRLTENSEAGAVGAAILSDGGKVYLGVCVDTGCGMGFCAEHAAAGAMLTAGQSRVRKMVAVYGDGVILPPCGRCREFISQLDDSNLDAEVLVAAGVVVRLRNLLPHDWKQSIQSEG
jgi:cytidine deaminase